MVGKRQHIVANIQLLISRFNTLYVLILLCYKVLSSYKVWQHGSSTCTNKLKCAGIIVGLNTSYLGELLLKFALSFQKTNVNSNNSLVDCIVKSATPLFSKI